MADLAKVDAPGRLLLHQRDRVLAVFVRGDAPFDDDQLDALRADGLQIRTVAGDVLTADGGPDAIEIVTERHFVRSVQVSAALFPEEPDSGQRPADTQVGETP
jgi:hypothetical protein